MLRRNFLKDHDNYPLDAYLCFENGNKFSVNKGLKCRCESAMLRTIEQQYPTNEVTHGIGTTYIGVAKTARMA